MLILVNCSNCHTSLQLPPSARSIRCAICQAVTQIADPRVVPPPSPHQYQQPPPPPFPYNHAPPGPPPNAHGRKKVVIDGISSRSGQYVWEDHCPRSGVWKGTNGGEVFSFSGCDNDQTSADTSALSKITSTGAMTFYFIQAIERGHGATYGSILTAMRNAIRQAGGSSGGDLVGGAVTSLISMLLAGGSFGICGGFSQEPQLTTCHPFDVYAKPFSL